MPLCIINWMIYILTINGKTVAKIINNYDHCASVRPRIMSILNIVLIFDHYHRLMSRASMRTTGRCYVRSVVLLYWRKVYAHIQEMTQVNKLSFNISKTKEITFKRRSLRNYTHPSPIVLIEQVIEAKLLSVFLIPTNSMLTYPNYITGIMNQRLYFVKLFKKTRSRH